MSQGGINEMQGLGRRLGDSSLRDDADGRGGDDAGDSHQGGRTGHLFDGVFTREPARREAGLQNLVAKLEADPALKALHARRLLTIATECPFEDVRAALRECLGAASVSAFAPMDTAFFSEEMITAIITDPVKLKKTAHRKELLEEIFVSTGRLALMMKFFSFFPEYLEHFWKASNFIFRDDGPLPVTWRHYIAVMAASCYASRYLMELHEERFLECGGDPQWLEEGMKAIPAKLANLRELNATLAYRPWRLKKDVIDKLLRAGSDSWTKSELVHAVTVMCLGRFMACFCFGCGIGIDPVAVAVAHQPSAADGALSSTATAVATSQVVTLLKSEAEQGPSEPGAENASLFQKAGDESSLAVQPAPRAQKLEARAAVQRYIGEIEIHEEITIPSPDYSTIRTQDYSWSVHGFELTRQYYPGLADLLDIQFQVAQTMSDKKFGRVAEDLDTTPFRRAIFYYILSVHGVFADDYNYRDINVYLSRDLKIYLKKIVHYPQTLLPHDFNSMGYELRPEEKVHINIIALEAKKQAELLYALKAISLKDTGPRG